MNVSEGRAFLCLDHSLRDALGLKAGTIDHSIFQGSNDWNAGCNTLVTRLETQAAGELVQHGPCEFSKHGLTLI